MLSIVSIHATLAGGDFQSESFAGYSYTVSIHATLAGGDFSNRSVDVNVNVSIHATLAGGDGAAAPVEVLPEVFLSTPPSRVATGSGLGEGEGKSSFLSTPPSRVATFWETNVSPSHLRFYPRHPRGWRQAEFVHQPL